MCVYYLLGSSTAHADEETCGYVKFEKETAGELANQLAIKAWGEHSDHFKKPSLIKGRKMPFTLKNEEQVSDFIEDILLEKKKATKDKKSKLDVELDGGLANDRIAWWEDKTGTVVIFDPNNEDCGSAFRPSKGKKYYDDLS